MCYRVDKQGLIHPWFVHTIVVSTQTAPGIPLEKVQADIRRYVIDAVIPQEYLTDETRFLVNPSGVFVIGGPAADAGLTGRKIIVDTYGGWGAHGGGAFSGKDYTKVDRSASYFCRYVAKSIVDAGLCRRCLVKVSYAIGVADALSVEIDDFNTSTVDRQLLIDAVRATFSFKPSDITRTLRLKRPIYLATATNCHFGHPEFTWEQTAESAEKLKQRVQSMQQNL